MATRDVYRWDLEEIERERAAQDKAERERTPRLSALVEELRAREYALLQDRATREEANTLYEIVRGLDMDLGFREIEPEAERALRTRWLGLVAPATSRLP